MRSLPACALASLLLLPLCEARAGFLPERWSLALDGEEGGDDFGRHVALDGFGGVVAVGSEVSPLGGGSLVATRRDLASGAEHWTVRIGPASSGAWSVAVDAAGDVLVAGSILNDFGVVKLAREDGGELWRKRVDGSAPFASDVAYAVAVDGAGDVLAAGLLENETTGPDFAVFKLDRDTGAELWRYEHDGTQDGDLNDRALAVALSPSGAVFAAGSIGTDGSGLDGYVAALDPADGGEFWSRVLDGGYAGMDLDDRIQDLAAASLGVYAVGQLRGEDGTDFSVFFLDPDDGTTIWERHLEGSQGASDAANAVATDALGNAFVAGRLDVEGTRQEFAVVRLGPTRGPVAWTFLLDGGAGGFDDATAVALDPAGETVFVAGSLIGAATGRDFGVVALRAASGAFLGRSLLDGTEEAEFWGDRAEGVVAVDGGAIAVGRLEEAESGADLAVASVPEPSAAALGAAPWAALALLARRRGARGIRQLRSAGRARASSAAQRSASSRSSSQT